MYRLESYAICMLSRQEFNGGLTFISCVFFCGEMCLSLVSFIQALSVVISRDLQSKFPVNAACLVTFS